MMELISSFIRWMLIITEYWFGLENQMKNLIAFEVIDLKIKIAKN